MGVWNGRRACANSGAAVLLAHLVEATKDDDGDDEKQERKKRRTRESNRKKAFQVVGSHIMALLLSLHPFSAQLTGTQARDGFYRRPECVFCEPDKK